MPRPRHPNRAPNRGRPTALRDERTARPPRRRCRTAAVPCEHAHPAHLGLAHRAVVPRPRHARCAARRARGARRAGARERRRRRDRRGRRVRLRRTGGRVLHPPHRHAAQPLRHGRPDHRDQRKPRLRGAARLPVRAAARGHPRRDRSAVGRHADHDRRRARSGALLRHPVPRARARAAPVARRRAAVAARDHRARHGPGPRATSPSAAGDRSRSRTASPQASRRLRASSARSGRAASTSFRCRPSRGRTTSPSATSTAASSSPSASATPARRFTTASARRTSPAARGSSTWMPPGSRRSRGSTFPCRGGSRRIRGVARRAAQRSPDSASTKTHGSARSTPTRRPSSIRCVDCRAGSRSARP